MCEDEKWKGVNLVPPATLGTTEDDMHTRQAVATCIGCLIHDEMLVVLRAVECKISHMADRMQDRGMESISIATSYISNAGEPALDFRPEALRHKAAEVVGKLFRMSVHLFCDPFEQVR